VAQAVHLAVMQLAVAQAAHLAIPVAINRNHRTLKFRTSLRSICIYTRKGKAKDRICNTRTSEGGADGESDGD
jgi:hypothetical protein